MHYHLVSAIFLFSSLCFAGGSVHDDRNDHKEHTKQEVHGHNDHKSLEQEVHMHGLAELTLVVEGSTLEIQLESPAANIVGFEHRARSTQQMAAVEKAQSVLESPARVFTLLGGECAVQQVSVALAGLTHQSEHAEHSDHDDDPSGHSEVRASYHYRCQKPETLKAVTVHLMRRFSGIETLNAQWVSATRQGAIELTAQFNRITIE